MAAARLLYWLELMYFITKYAIFIWIAALMAIQVVTLFLLGRNLICPCGYVSFWEGGLHLSTDSQHLTDWFTFSHIIHGFLFYGVTAICFPRLSVGQRLCLAVGAEVAWEILENTSWIINAYRAQEIANTYAGDSIINSVSDTLAMIGGFVLARYSPVWLIVGLIIMFEVSVGLSIRDNFTLNVLNFIHPIESITDWQNGG